MLTSSAGFVVIQRGPGGFWLDCDLGISTFELAHSQFGSASSVTAPAAEKHPPSWPGEPHGLRLQLSHQLHTPQSPLPALSKEIVIRTMRPQPSGLRSDIVSAVTRSPLTQCVILKQGQHPPARDRGTKASTLHQFSAENLQV